MGIYDDFKRHESPSNLNPASKIFSKFDLNAPGDSNFIDALPEINILDNLVIKTKGGKKMETKKEGLIKELTPSVLALTIYYAIGKNFFPAELQNLQAQIKPYVDTIAGIGIGTVIAWKISMQGDHILIIKGKKEAKGNTQVPLSENTSPETNPKENPKIEGEVYSRHLESLNNCGSYATQNLQLSETVQPGVNCVNVQPVSDTTAPKISFKGCSSQTTVIPHVN